MTSYVFTSTHEIFYSNRDPVPIAEIVESLLALERIVKASPRVLEGITRVPIERVEVYVEELATGSLLERIAVKLFFKDEADLDAFLARVRDRIRKPGMERNLLIGAVIFALAGYGAWLAANSQKVPNAPAIMANNNVIINLGAGEVDLTPEAFRAIVEAAVTDKKDLAKSAVRFFKPARSDSEAGIRLDDNEALTFPSPVIAATPVQLEFDKQERVEHFKDVDLHIRATNLDSMKKGWAALMPGYIDRRVRLELDPSVKPTDVAGRFQLRADVSVIYKLDKTAKKQVADYILLREVIKD